MYHKKTKNTGIIDSEEKEICRPTEKNPSEQRNEGSDKQ